MDAEGTHGPHPPLTREEYLAAYVAGELDPSTYDEVDLHLMECETCWQDQQLAQAGRAAAVASVEPVPDELRSGLVALFADLREETSVVAMPSRPTWRRVLPALAVAAAVVTAFVAGLSVSGGEQEPLAGRPAPTTAPSVTPPSPSVTSVLSLALDGYRNATLPGTGVPSEAAPDLRELGLNLTAASTGRLGRQPVSVFAYEDPTTRSPVFVYLSGEQFRDVTPPRGAATTMREVDSITVYADTVHPMLVVGRDKDIVESVGDRLTSDA